MSDCAFCALARGEIPARIVHEDERTISFLDHRPFSEGHVLVATRDHYETLLDVPEDLLGTIFTNAQRAARAIETSLGAHGSFVAVNVRIMQSVPHFHAHVIPRWRNDGMFLRFFWPWRRYASEARAEEVRSSLARAIAEPDQSEARPTTKNSAPAGGSLPT